jgi:hypothetical protein
LQRLGFDPLPFPLPFPFPCPIGNGSGNGNGNGRNPGSRNAPVARHHVAPENVEG